MTNAQVKADIAANLPDNTSGLITPAKLRTEMGKVVDYSDTSAAAAVAPVAVRVTALEEGPVVSAGRFYVKDYGAAGDGVANDTVGVQATINAAAIAGGVVYFGNSTCRVSALTLPANNNVHFLGDQANLVGTASGVMVTIAGYPSVYKRVHVEGILFSAEVGGVTAISVTDTAIYLRNCTIAISVAVGVRIIQAVNAHIHDCSILPSACALWLEGTEVCYTGFMEVSNSRLGSETNVCAIYADSTNYIYGSGGIEINNCWFEGFGGLAIYAKGASMYSSPISLRGCWFEGIGGSATVDLSMFGGPESIPVAGYPLYLDGSSVQADVFWSSARLRNGSTLSADRLFLFPEETSGMIDCDQSSTVDIADVQSLGVGGVFCPYGSKTNIRQSGASFVECSPKTELDAQNNNLMGVTGVASAAFYHEDVVGVTITESVRDTTAPVFKSVAELSVGTGKNLPVYARPDWSIVFTASKYYAVSYSLRVVSGEGDVRLNWGNRTPTIPWPVLADGKWHTFTGIVQVPVTGENQLYVSHTSAGTLVLRISSIQVVEFSDAQSAYLYSASNRFAANQAGQVMPATWTHRASTGAPTFNAEYIGQECYDASNTKWYKAKDVGTGASDWVALN